MARQQTNSNNTLVRGVLSLDENTENYYRSILPADVVHYIEFDAPVSLTYESAHTVWRKFGPNTLSMLKVAMALDTQEQYGLTHPGSFDRVKAAFGM